jgi:hypothetical protein
MLTFLQSCFKPDTKIHSWLQKKKEQPPIKSTTSKQTWAVIVGIAVLCLVAGPVLMDKYSNLSVSSYNSDILARIKHGSDSSTQTVSSQSQPSGPYGKMTSGGGGMDLWWVLDFGPGVVREYMANTFTGEKELRNLGQWSMSGKDIRVSWQKGHTGLMRFDGRDGINSVYSDGVTFQHVRINGF